jgi:hypothetical protein
VNLGRIRAEFLEMPGLSLTANQAARLWGMDLASIEPMLKALVDSGFLWRTNAGQYVRRGDSPEGGRVPRPHVKRRHPSLSAH